MIKLTHKAPMERNDAVSPHVLNNSLSEIESVFNKIGVVRGFIPNALKDYFLFDKDKEKLYLVTIEGLKFEVTIT